MRFISLLLLTTALQAQPAPPGELKTPAATKPVAVRVLPASGKVIQQFHAALKAGDIQTARTFIADFPKPVADLDRRLSRLAKKFSDDQLVFTVLDAKESANAAVAIISTTQKGGAKTFEADQWYLIRQNDQWKLLPNPNDYELPNYGLDKGAIERYQELETWSQTRTGELRKELTGCDC